MASQTRYAGTVVDDASTGTIAWSNPANAQGSPNGTVATAGAPSTGQTHYLKATSYGFAIPEDARIDGIVVTPTYSSSGGAGKGADSAAPRLLRAGVLEPLTSHRASNQFLPTSLAEVKHGAANDNWNAPWTPADINDGGFGVVLRLASVGGSTTHSVDAIAITVYYTRPQSAIPVAVFRAGDAPHGAAFQEYPDALTYSMRLRAMQTGSMLISRASPNAARLANLLQQQRPPMVTIEWPDGFTPFVGFVTGFEATLSDTHYKLQFEDHCSKLAIGRTKTTPARRMQAAAFMAEVLGEMMDRAAPPININLAHLVGGPDVNRELRAEQGDTFVRAMENDTDYDAFFSYAISPGGVETWQELAHRQGVDRSTEEVWQEGKQIVDATVAYDYKRGAQTATVIGGAGAFGSRPQVTETQQAIGGGGTIVSVQQAITDQQMLQQRAAALLASPANATRTGVSKILETAIDRSRFGVGDIRVQRFQTTFLGVPIDIKTRITAIAMNPATGIHDCTWVEVA